MALRRRPEQVGEVVRQIVAEALLHEIRDPRIGLVTVTRVEMSPDLSHARLFVVVPGTPEEREAVMKGLANAAGFFRSKVAKVLATRITPGIAFSLDRGVEHAAKIDAILAGLREPIDGGESAS